MKGYLKYRLSPNVSAAALLIVALLASSVALYMVNRAYELADHYEEYYGATNYSSSYQGAIVNTNLGIFSIQFIDGVSTTTINNFIKLAEAGFYDGTKFHRVVRGFVIQGGDPNTKGTNERDFGAGGPGYTISDEINSVPMKRGVVAMANRGPNTNGSQFFIVAAPSAPQIQGRYTVFAKVVRGMDVVDAINKTPTKPGDIPVKPVVVERIALY